MSIFLTWDASKTNVTNMPREATHGAIGGTPGYSPDTSLQQYNWTRDVALSIEVDSTMRRIAHELGVPINVIGDSAYGFPASQSGLPRVKPVDHGRTKMLLFQMALPIGLGF
jgi:hypothetical protein